MSDDLPGNENDHPRPRWRDVSGDYPDPGRLIWLATAPHGSDDPESVIPGVRNEGFGWCYIDAGGQARSIPSSHHVVAWALIEPPRVPVRAWAAP